MAAMADSTPPAPADDGEAGGAPPPTGRFARFFKLSSLSTGVLATGALGKVRKVFAKGGAEAVAIEAKANLDKALKIAETLGELKGAVMKLGQVISIQEDAVPKEFRDVLSRLQSQAPPMHPSYAIDVIQTELKRKLDDLFADFERKPFAAASLGQVHRATLKGSGEPVVVKVQYPGIDETIETDLKLAGPIVKAIALTGKSYDMREMLQEVRERLAEELDYVHEADNQERMRELLGGCPHVVVPRVVRSHSARRVITMERLDGIHLDAYVAAETDPERRNAMAAKLSDLLWRMQVEIGMLHADPHPGNFLFLPDGRIGLLDFGCVKVFPEEFLRNYVTLIRRVVRRDDAGILEVYERMGFLTAEERAGAASSERMKEWLRWSYLCCTGLDEDRDFPDPARGESWGRFITDLHESMSRHIFKVGCYTPKDAVYLNRVTIGIMCFWRRLEARGNWHRIMMRHIEAAEARLGMAPPVATAGAAG
jgi:predicted unusual protein kinase regulating ubiquinone biosynthesis (AarF/ABC1/UbiB family)